MTEHATAADQNASRVTGVIYELVDPRDGVCRYVGQTINMRARRKSHTSPTPIYQSNEGLHRWKIELTSLGLLPEFRVIEECVSLDRIDEQERFWCRDRADKGCELLNRPVGKIRKCDLLGAPKRNELANQAREIRSRLFSLSDEIRGKFPSGKGASEHLRRSIGALLAFIHEVEDG